MIETLIIIRTKNEDRWIKHTIEKINTQTYKKFKIVVVDNYSTDRTVEIVKQYELSILKIKNFIPGKAINIAYKKFPCKFVVCLSAHCIPENNKWLQNLIKNFKNKKTVAVYGKQLPIYNTSDANYRDLKIVFGNDKRIQKKDYFFHNANSAIRTQILKKYPFSEKATNIEDRLWAKQIIDLNKFQIVYEPKASVYHHHGLHQNNNKKRLNGVVNIMKGIETENLMPDELVSNNQKIFACLIGKTNKKITNTYKKTNNELIKKLNDDPRIQKIFVVVDNKTLKELKELNSNKFFIVKRNKYLNEASINSILKFFYTRLKKYNVDYLAYFNLDYIKRPKNFLNALISTSTKDFHNITTYAEKFNNVWYEEKNNIIKKTDQLGNNKDIGNYYHSLYGLGSIFFYNSLKNLNLEKNTTFLINTNNPKYSLRFSQIDND